MPDVAFNDLPAERAAQYTSQMTHTAASVFRTPITYEPWQDIPCTYIMCEDDHALPLAYQQQMASMMSGVTTFKIKAGHCPFLSVPEKVVEGLELAVKVGKEKRSVA